MRSLLCNTPAPSLAREMRLYGQFAGRWQTEITVHAADGSERHANGEWEFSYALEGRAVVDVWQVPPRSTLGLAERQAGQECGLCVRVYDPALKLWRFTYHGPLGAMTVHMFAQRVGDEIIQECLTEGRLMRWIFSNITPERFDWRSVSSDDGGARWRLEQTVVARRKTDTVQMETGNAG